MSRLSTPLSYPIHVEAGLLQGEELPQVCHTFERLFLLCDTTVYPLYGKHLLTRLLAQGLVVTPILIPPGEQEKTRERKACIEDQLLEQGCTRKSALLALGGGVILDLVGFVGATFHRGIPVLYLPTTLLSMVDAAVGGKTGVNTPMGKNLIGSFTPPHSIWMDPSTLSTLPESEILNGLGEIAKHALLGNPTTWMHLQETSLEALDWNSLLQQSIQYKAHIVAQDEREQGMRTVLNLGHTVGHALEKACDHRLPHGVCVALGLWIETRIAYMRGLLPEIAHKQVEKWVHLRYGSFLALASSLPWEALVSFLSQDKKGRGIDAYPMILLCAVGEVWHPEDRWVSWVSKTEVQLAWATTLGLPSHRAIDDISNLSHSHCQWREPRPLG
jgi:3-dehydroquinate synthase